MDRAHVLEWLAGYERAWREPGSALLAELFTEDVTYVPSPWREPLVGLEALAAFWDEARDEDEAFDAAYETVAVEGDTAVVRVAVGYRHPHDDRWRSLWVMRFAPDGRCAAFEEWPFAPKQRDGHE